MNRSSLVFLIGICLLCINSACKKCEALETFDTDITLVFKIYDKDSGEPIGNSITGQKIKLYSGDAEPLLLVKTWENVGSNVSEFSVDVTPSCGLPTKSNYRLNIGDFGFVVGFVQFDKTFIEERCSDICSGKFISRIEFGAIEEDYTYNDGRTRAITLML